MDREEIRKTVELLRKIDVEEYGLEFHEVVAAGAVKAYLCGLPRQEALGKLRAIMKGTVLKIPALDEKPELLQTTVKGIELIKLIDTAVAAQIDTIKKQTAKERPNIREIAISSLCAIEKQRLAMYRSACSDRILQIKEIDEWEAFAQMVAVRLTQYFK